MVEVVVVVEFVEVVALVDFVVAMTIMMIKK